MTSSSQTNPKSPPMAMWETVVKDDDTLDATAIGKTIVPPQSALETFERQHTLGALPRIDPEGDISEFRVTKTLGEGGMGLVRLAHQASLGREVAIKTIRPEQAGPAATHDLLEESWVTGMLEHPNIVPIHALGVDENAAPMLVMKRVEGMSWAEALIGGRPMPDAFRGGRDELEDHLQILLQVCNAVQFAHSKGIVHCDLKPENIMLGEYGEVYLLDWGIAVTLVDDGTGRLPLAKDVDAVAGTPAYIAPELAGGEGRRIDCWTDVYLLGAILHEVVTGEPRHAAESVMATLLKAYRSDPIDYADDVPAELGAICNKATHLEPEQRFEDVESFRRAVIDFLQHRDSQRLADEASRRLDSLEEVVSQVLDGQSATPDAQTVDDAAVEAYRLFNECRFGFEQALQVWEHNQDAHDGLKRALEAMIEFELHQRNAQAAQLLVDELADPFNDYDVRLAALREELAEEADEIERNRRLRQDIDLNLASHARSKMCVLLGLVFGGVPLIQYGLVSQGYATHTFQDYFIQFATVITGASFVVWLFRERLLSNKINRRIIISVFLILGGALIMRLLGYMLGLDPAGCIALENGLIAFAMGMMATSIDRRIGPAAAAFAAGGFLGAWDPEHILIYDGLSNAGGLWLIAFAWRGANSDEQAVRSKE